MRRQGRKFLFDLALALRMPVGEMLHRMTSAELSEWKALATLEPIGERRADWRAAQIERAVYMASEHVDRDKLPPVGELLLRWRVEGEPDDAQSTDSQIQALKRAEEVRRWAQPAPEEK